MSMWNLLTVETIKYLKIKWETSQETPSCLLEDITAIPQEQIYFNSGI